VECGRFIAALDCGGVALAELLAPSNLSDDRSNRPSGAPRQTKAAINRTHSITQSLGVTSSFVEGGAHLD